MASNLKYGTLYYENEYDGPLADGYGDPRQVIAHGLGFDFEVDFNEHGNLYTWEEALAACPEGWRLPTDEDWPRRRNRIRPPISRKRQFIQSSGTPIFEFLERIRILLDSHGRGKQRLTRNNRVLP